MKKIIAKKVEMNQIFSDTGEVFPVTLLVGAGEESLDSDFQEGDTVNVSGKSKGKGFQGVVKRHGFKGDSRTHGRKHSERSPGSIGGGGRSGGKVIKGMRMGGRMGNTTITVKNLKIVKIIPETKEIFIRGAVPGRRGTAVEIRSTKS